MSEDKITIRLGSSTFLVPRKNIIAHPETTLAKSLNGDTKKRELVYDRSPQSFHAICNYYLFGKFHIPSSVCPGEFREELNFWNIPDSKLELCCVLKYHTYLEDVKNLDRFRQKEASSTDSSKNPLSSRRQVWRVLDNQSKSVVNTVYNFLSTTLVFSSIVVITLNIGHSQSNENTPESPIQHNTSSSFQRPDTTERPNEQNAIDSQCKPTEINNADFERLIMMEKICMKDCPGIKKPDISFCGRNCSTEVWNTYYGHKTLYVICRECHKLYSLNIPKSLPESDEYYYDYDDDQYYYYNNEQIPSNSSMEAANDTVFVFDPHTSRIGNEKSNLIHLITNYIRKVSNDLQIKDMIDFENIFVILYTTEFMLRFVTCPSRIWFLVTLLNIFDFVSISASWTKIGIILSQLALEKNIVNILMIGQMIRVFRLLRSIKHLKAFKVLSYAALKGCQDLLVIVLYVLVGIVIFGTLMFFVEPQETFPDIGQAVWWSIITMTTVGYGDVYPMTIPGKVIACICALYGIVMLALTIPLFAQTFHTIYQFASLEDNNNEVREKTRKYNEIV